MRKNKYTIKELADSVDEVRQYADKHDLSVLDACKHSGLMTISTFNYRKNAVLERTNAETAEPKPLVRRTEVDDSGRVISDEEIVAATKALQDSLSLVIGSVNRTTGEIVFRGSAREMAAFAREFGKVAE